MDDDDAKIALQRAIARRSNPPLPHRMTKAQRAAAQKTDPLDTAKFNINHVEPSREITPVDMAKYAPWILANMSNKSVTEKDEPGPGAFWLLTAVRDTDSLKMKLAQLVFDIAANAEVTTTERFNDDGRDVERQLDELIADFTEKNG